MDTDGDTIEIQKYLDAFKAHLKENKLTYKVLAERLDIAEVSVKRLCNSKTISLEKLIQLCRAADWSFSELVSQVQAETVTHHFFNDIQDEAFYQHPELLSYFSLLFYEGQSAEQIADAYDLDELSTYQYLRELERLQILTLGTNNTIRFLVKAPLGFTRHSKVLKQDMVDALAKTSEAIFNDQDDSQAFFLLKPLYISQALYRKLAEDIQELISRYAEISELSKDFSVQEGYYQIAVGASFETQEQEELAVIPRLSTNHFS